MTHNAGTPAVNTLSDAQHSEPKGREGVSYSFILKANMVGNETQAGKQSGLPQREQTKKHTFSNMCSFHHVCTCCWCCWWCTWRAASRRGNFRIAHMCMETVDTLAHSHTHYLRLRTNASVLTPPY